MANCSWCGIEKISYKIDYCQCEYLERHKLCSSCHLKDHACQSSCPLCWYDLAEKYIKKENLCSGCIQPLNDNENKIDKNFHKLCKLCDQCILCLFRLETKKDFFILSYRQLNCQRQKILYQMQNCVQKIEYDYELCSICMELLNYNNYQIQILNQCKHRFHSDCIEKWFKEKPCCPCCRHIYQIHDQPSNLYI